MLKELSLCHAGRRNDNYADNNGNNNGNGNENGYDKGTGHKECRDRAETVFKLHRIHFFFLLNYDKQKTSLQLITAERLEFLFLIPFLSTITSRTAADNNGGDNNNHAVNVVEKLSHLILISFEISLIYHIFFIISRGEEKKIIIFLILSLPWI